MDFSSAALGVFEWGRYRSLCMVILKKQTKDTKQEE